MDDIMQMKALIKELNEASNAYYNTGRTLMDDWEWDMKLEHLKSLEQKTGITMSMSPTRNVGYEVASKLPKAQHKKKALSLNKTKDIGELAAFQGNRKCVLSWKLDGLTIVASYDGGKLVSAVTRGNGMEGEVVTENAKAFANMPLSIPYKGELTVRGEAIITYADFARINASLPEGEEPYANPRNLCSGSVRQLDPRETKKRGVQFKAFAMVKDVAEYTTRSGQLERLKDLGFDTVDYVIVASGAALPAAIQACEEKMPENGFPSDGLVLQFNDAAYGESLGCTEKYPRDAMAFKWTDEAKETTLQRIEWSPSRTGLINPVAVFDPVELEGTTVTRASTHNVSITESLGLCPGDVISVHKANMIIPQVAENLSLPEHPQAKAEIPRTCPACGGDTEIRTGQKEGTRTLWCTNPHCSAKHIGKFVHAVKRDALNMEGLSEETLKKFINAGLLTELSDLFHLKDHKEEITAMEGFGEKSFESMAAGIENARHTNLQRLIYAFGIDNVGRTASKAICCYFNYDVENTVSAPVEVLKGIIGVGDVIAASFADWFRNQLNQERFEAMLDEVHLRKPSMAAAGKPLANRVFVITGAVTHYENRAALKAEIELLGGKVTGSVSRNTDFLINNDSMSMTTKNKKAKELGVRIITEDEYRKMAGVV